MSFNCKFRADPVLVYEASDGEHSGELSVLPTIYEKQNCEQMRRISAQLKVSVPDGIVFPTGSDKRVPVNSVLLEIQENGAYEELLEEYFASAGSDASDGDDDLGWSSSGVWVVYVCAVIIAFHCCGLMYIGWNDHSMSNLVKDLSLRGGGRADEADEDPAASMKEILARLDHMQQAIDSMATVPAGSRRRKH